MLAQISVFPLDKGGFGLSKYVAESIKIIRDSGLDYQLHAMGTLVEGPAEDIFDLIRKLHENMIRQSDRVIMDIKIDDKKGSHGQIRQKVRSVEEKI